MIWRGEIYQIDLGQPIGREAGFERPGLVISGDLVNNGAGGIVTVIPVTSRSFGLRSHIELEAGTSGLDRQSFARCDQLRTISDRRLTRRLGAIPWDAMEAVNEATRFVLDL